MTGHEFVSGGARVAFTATVATLPLADDKGERQAGIFHVAWTRDEANAPRRPVMFVFNGGPCASSAYLHLAALRPRTVALGQQGQMPAPASELIDNPDHWLDLSDLVFIDPVGAGYSRAVGDAGRRYWGVTEDLVSIATFIDRCPPRGAALHEDAAALHLKAE